MKEAPLSTFSPPKDEQQEQQEHSIVLFYKYHPLSSKPELVELYRSALEHICLALQLQGRILVGCNDNQSEGINGTLSGSHSNVQVFVQGLTQTIGSSHTNPILENFWKACQDFYLQAGCEPLIMKDSEFKWSISGEQQLFPDLNIKVVKELIGTGGVLADISLKEVHQGYLTPQEWHKRLSLLEREQNNSTILIDCRNTKEHEIGHFPNSMDPNTTTFHQFPTWVQQHSQSLADKTILMYCTGTNIHSCAVAACLIIHAYSRFVFFTIFVQGGVRCEKASAYIRRQVPSVKEVCHLKGGIHKYLDEYGTSGECLWKGKNFVFDGRCAHGAAGEEENKQASKVDCIVGKCSYCHVGHDVFFPGIVCTVCREPTLVCQKCQGIHAEYHCKNHFHLKSCYFTNLEGYSAEELQQQLEQIRHLAREIAVGKKFKQKRKTLHKQCQKIIQRLEALEATNTTSDATAGKQEVQLKCRNCGQVRCAGDCWGFHGLKRKRVLEEQQQQEQRYQDPQDDDTTTASSKLKNTESSAKPKNKQNNAHLQKQKEQEQRVLIEDLVDLQLAKPPAFGRNTISGLRVPIPCTRILQTKTKGKWCGKALLGVLQREFGELQDALVLKNILKRGLLFVNDTPIASLEEAESLRLKNMDSIRRIVHWHEPPVNIPKGTIQVQKVSIPQAVCDENDLDQTDDAYIYVCDKPSTVPVHPAGPYLSNSLTMMVEAQEGLPPKSLIPCHRIDRVTSGLTLCCTSTSVARLIQGRMADHNGSLNSVQKLYLAQVHGKFPSNKDDGNVIEAVKSTDIAQWKWKNQDDNTKHHHTPWVLKVQAPIETVNPANGIRKITKNGKPSQSLFRLVSYNPDTDTSIIACCPLTGRSHQLRVHLQWLRYSIVKDIQYGGKNTQGAATSNIDDSANAVFYCVDEQPKSKQVSQENVQAAKEVCLACQDLSKAFTPAQLLQEGHEVCLHAYRYRIPFLGNPTKHNKKYPTVDVDEAPALAVVDLQVPPPAWVTDYSFLDGLNWL